MSAYEDAAESGDAGSEKSGCDAKLLSNDDARSSLAEQAKRSTCSVSAGAGETDEESGKEVSTETIPLLQPLPLPLSC